MTGKNIFQTIREKEMDRKTFLRHSGLVLLGAIGLKAVVNLLLQAENAKTSKLPQKDATRSFGGGKYGA